MRDQPSSVACTDRREVRDVRSYLIDCILGRPPLLEFDDELLLPVRDQQIDPSAWDRELLGDQRESVTENLGDVPGYEDFEGPFVHFRSFIRF